MRMPAGTVLPFPWVRVHGNRAFVSGHAPLASDGTLARPLGKVGADLTLEQGYDAARLLLDRDGHTVAEVEPARLARKVETDHGQ